MEYTSRVPRVTISPVFAPFLSIRVLIAVVEPWNSSPIADGSRPLLRMQSMMPWTSWAGVVRLFAWANRPVRPSNAIKSVNVPPMSIAAASMAVSYDDGQSDNQTPLPMVPGQRALSPLPRRGVGGAGPRRPAALRVPDPRRRPGRLVLVDDPQQAGQLPQGIRPVRPRKGRALRRTRGEEAAGRRRHRAQPSQDRIGDRQRPRVPRSAAGIRLVRRLSLGFRRPAPRAESPARHERSAGAHAAIRRAQQRPEGARVPLRRLDHRLGFHAGGRRGQRSPFRLFSPRAAGGAPKTPFFG